MSTFISMYLSQEQTHKLFFTCKIKMGKKLKKNFSLWIWTNEPSVESLGAWGSHYDFNTDEQWLNTLLLKPNEIWTKLGRYLQLKIMSTLLWKEVRTF